MSSTPPNIFCRVTHAEMTPRLRLVGEIVTPLGTSGTLSLDTTARYCIGWHELSTNTSHPCPEGAVTDPRFDVCPACQNRTGFNPAFYHATTVSPQQEQRNAEPHLLYLAYMGPNYIKVGITWAGRGHTRLLDQGALAYVLLDTFPTALMARQYEAKLAATPSFHETTTTKKKLQLLEHPFESEAALQALSDAKQRATTILGIALSDNAPISLIEHYFYSKNDISSVAGLHSLEQPVTSGTHIALIGDILLTHHDDQLVALPLKKYYGYPLTLQPDIAPLDLPATQLGLF